MRGMAVSEEQGAVASIVENTEATMGVGVTVTTERITGRSFRQIYLLRISSDAENQIRISEIEGVRICSLGDVPILIWC